MRLGFTGTRTGMTEAQRQSFRSLVEQHRPVLFLHGACVGADEDAVRIVRETLGRDGCHVVARPGRSAYDASRGKVNEHRSDAAIALSDEVLPEQTHFARNREIVLRSDLLVATPWQQKSQRPAKGTGGGTWYTVDFACGQRCGVVVVWPDGEVEWLAGSAASCASPLSAKRRRASDRW